MTKVHEIIEGLGKLNVEELHDVMAHATQLLKGNDYQLVAEIFSMKNQTFITYHVAITPDVVKFLDEVWGKNLKNLREYCEKNEKKDEGEKSDG